MSFTWRGVATIVWLKEEEEKMQNKWVRRRRTRVFEMGIKMCSGSRPSQFAGFVGRKKRGNVSVLSSEMYG